MAFEDVNILVRKDAEPTEVRWRQDAAIGSLITFSLSDTRDVRTFKWEIIGRPEGSGAGGGGPEPITLTTAQTCSITLDIPGAYIVSCTINGGSPNQTFKTAGVSILCTITDPLGRPLRFLGGYETDEDLADPLVAQGWIKMLDRWLHALEAYITGGGQADTFKVAMDDADVTAAGYDFLPRKTHAGDYIALEVVTDAGVQKLQISTTLEPDDHEVKADSTDTGHGPLKDKLKDTATLVWSVDTTGGVHKVKGDVQGIPAADDHLVKARNADATTVGGLMEKTISTPTIERTLTVDGDGTEVVSFNTIAQVDPISFASTLYAAHLDDPALFSSVVCAFYKIVGGGANFVTSFNPDYTEWEEIRPGVFKSTLSGQGSIRDYIPDGITPVAGMRVASVNPTEYPMNLAYDEIRTGVYIITNPGYTGTVGEAGYREDYAVLERAPELDASADFASGCVFQVNQGVGAGKYFRMTNAQPIVLGTTELTWEVLTSYTATASDNLLTAAQLARASETPNTTALVASDGSPSAWLKFPTLAGTPNLDTYRAGRTEAWVLARLHAEGSAGSITWLECLVVRDPGGDDATLETINTSPVTSSTDEIIKAHIDDATDQDLAGDGIGLWIRARSDSTTPAAIAVTWSDPAHSTRLLTPMTLAVGGTDDHQALTNASRGWVSGQEKWARSFGHPSGFICNRFPVDCSATIETGDGAGILVIPDTCSGPVRVTGTELRAIAVKDADGNTVFGKQAELRIHFVDTCIVRHLDSLSGVTTPWQIRSAKLHLFPPPGAEGADMDIQIPALRTARLYLDQPSGGVLTWYLEVMQ
jgi:hypothetical protein